MPRQNLNVDGKIGGKKCKVRKRGCSSSSSSSFAQSYRLKRAFLVGKRVGSSTPVPVWRIMSSLRSPGMESDKALFKYVVAKGGEKGREVPVSARKLAATLWEIDNLASPRVSSSSKCMDDKLSEVGVSRKDRNLESSRLGSLAIGLSDPFRSPASEKIMDPPKRSSHRRRASVSSQKLMRTDGNLGVPESPQNCLVEVDQTLNDARSPFRNISGTKNRLKDVYNGLTTSKELLKVMSRVSRVEQQNSTCLSLVSALKFELDRACVQVFKLMQEQKGNRSEIDVLLKQFEEQKVVWKMKEQDRIQNAITSIAGDLEVEKKLRRQTERVNKKLGTELAETKVLLMKANKELQGEKRAREIVEQVCDELARGIGDDKAEVEELKRQSDKVREEVEKEREMLQIADVLREERVQMKLLEARHHFEEKNALVDKLKNDLEVYLKSKKSTEKEVRVDESPNYEKIRELEKYLRETLPSSYQYEANEKQDFNKALSKEREEEEDDDDSVDSEFHSIELNVSELGKAFQWNGVAKTESRRNSVDKSKGRKSISEKTKKQTISSDTKYADGIEWEFTNSKHENADVVNKRGFFEFSSPTWKRDIEDEMERYNMIKNLRDQIASSKIASSQDLADSVSSKNPNGLLCEG